MLQRRQATTHVMISSASCTQVINSQAAPKFLMVGSYPKGSNILITTGLAFNVNLMVPPFSFLPERIYSEDEPDLKHILVYRKKDLEAWNLDEVAQRIKNGWTA